jgi:hypothetical protein
MKLITTPCAIYLSRVAAGRVEKRGSKQHGLSSAGDNEPGSSAHSPLRAHIFIFAKSAGANAGQYSPLAPLMPKGENSGEIRQTQALKAKRIDSALR